MTTTGTTGTTGTTTAVTATVAARRLPALTPEQAQGRARELLADIVERHGSAGEMVSTMANSPAMIEGYLSLSRAMKRVKIPRALSEKLSLAVQERIGCGTCREAHASAGPAAGLTAPAVAPARQGTSTDPREAALIALALKVLAEPGGLGDADVAEVRAHGWSDRIIAGVVGLVSLSLLTGAFNLLAGIQPDAGEEPEPAGPPTGGAAPAQPRTDQPRTDAGAGRAFSIRVKDFAGPPGCGFPSFRPTTR
ncbi:carboxymuconolactone decarboxylase family protein [Streptomyces omiyaensis]|uniref:carboxymuconolactone decarboxylase family protein n=1 Tax=Streptomyces omiyaensis TaxID=68247 RepID=UPI0036F76662